MPERVRTESGGPARTPRSEISGPVIPPARREEVGVEPVLFWDRSGSTDWEIAPGAKAWDGKAGGRRTVMREVARQLVVHLESLDAEAAREQAGGSDEMGGLLTFFFGSESSQGIDLNSANFDRKVDEQQKHWGGGTHIIKAWEQALNEYEEEFGDRPERERPVHLCLVLTDGELDDMDLFAANALSTASPHRVFLVLICGYDEDPQKPRHSMCIKQYGEIAARQQAADPHGKSYIRVISFDSVSDPDEIADDARILIG